MLSNDMIGFASEALKDIAAWDIDATMCVEVTSKPDKNPVRVTVRAARAGFLPANPSSPTAIGAHELVLIETEDSDMTASRIEARTLVIEPSSRCISENRPATPMASEIVATIKAWVDAVISIEIGALVTT